MLSHTGVSLDAGNFDPTPFSKWWPGTEGLSSVSITSYNRAYSTPNHQYSNSFKVGFENAYNQVSP